MRRYHRQNPSENSAAGFIEVPAHGYEQACLQSYTMNVLQCRSPIMRRDASHSEIVGWLYHHHEEVGFPLKAMGDLEEIFDDFDETSFGIRIGFIEEDLKTLQPIINSAVDWFSNERLLRKDHAASTLQTKIDCIATLVDLTGEEANILSLLARVAVYPTLRELKGNLPDDDSSGHITLTSIALMLGVRASTVQRFLKEDGALQRFGLVVFDGFGEYGLNKSILDVINDKHTAPDTIQNTLIGSSADTQLCHDDFVHMQRDFQFCEGLLTAATSNSTTGVSLLLHGAPGTGKTEFAKLISKTIGADCIFIGENRWDANEEPSREDRLAQYALASKLAERMKDVVLVMDEADDIFMGQGDGFFFAPRGSKLHLNRLIERVKVPTIWICNDASHLGEPVLRRMNHAVSFRKPSRKTREKVIYRISKAHGLPLKKAGMQEIVGLDVSPAILDASFGATKLVQTSGRPTTETVTASVAHFARSLCEAAGHQLPPSEKSACLPFDPSLSNASMDLTALVEQIKTAKTKAFSFLFHGAPGTGKSAYARHIAEALEMDVMVKRASNLISPYVGATEANIATAFMDAEKSNALLIMDEADTFLQDRRNAQRSWEVSQVNEMLTWMERHPLPFAMTTNMRSDLDPASRRRFLFDVEFKTLDDGQAARLFERTFKCKPPKALARLDGLVPADFEIVHRRTVVMGELSSPQAIAFLEDLVAERNDARRRKIGF